jgi:hypothetical protein
MVSSDSSIKGFSSESIEVQKSQDDLKSRKSSNDFIEQVHWYLDSNNRHPI